MAHKLNKGITLYELLIVVVLISLLMAIVLGTNFMTQINKAKDLRVKDGMEKIAKVLEDFQVDHGRYPTMEEIAYELMDDVGSDWNTALAGKICGTRKTSEAMRPYVSELPCHPQSPDKDYVYFLYDNQQKYAIFVNLDNHSDPMISKVGCLFGCSYYLNVSNPLGSLSHNYFNYYVGSSDVNPGNCYGTYAYVACYPDRQFVNDRCRPCANYNCTSGYATLYCNVNWCLSDCQ